MVPVVPMSSATSGQTTATSQPAPNASWATATQPMPNVFGLANFEPAEYVFLLVLSTWAFAAGYYAVAAPAESAIAST